MKRSKTVTVEGVCAAMEELAPPHLNFSWDKGGLMVGNPSVEVHCVLVALTVSGDVVREAVRRRADMIVSHHPLIWEPLSSLRWDEPKSRVCLELATAGIACYSAHTCLDVAVDGVNDVLARKIGLQDIMPMFTVPQSRQVKLVTFVPESHLDSVRSAVCQAGAGVIGEYTYCSFSTAGVGTFMPSDKANPFSGKKKQLNEEPERRFEVILLEGDLARVLAALRQAHPYEEPAYDIVLLGNHDSRIALGRRGVLRESLTLAAFAERLTQLLDVSAVRVVGDARKLVRHVGVIGGSAGTYLKDTPKDVDVMVTGDVRYHDALDAQERGLAVIDVGHAAGERCVVPWVARFLRKRLSVRVFSYVDKDPFYIVLRK